MYTAWKGGGTYVNGTRVHVTNQDNLERALLVRAASYTACPCVHLNREHSKSGHI